MSSNLARLISIGFIKIGSWHLEDSTIKPRIDKHGTSTNFLYAFVSDSIVLYIGKSIQTLRKRLYQYQRPGNSQRTNIRVGSQIASLLMDHRSVDIYIFIDSEGLAHKGIKINLAAGLEDNLISEIQPSWNIMSKKHTKQKSSANPEKPITLLIVDDIYETRKKIIEKLKSHGDISIVGEARTGLEAIDQFRKHNPDIVIMDTHMPEMDGISATEAIIGINPKAVVIISSIHDDPDFIRRSHRAGASYYCIIPDLDDLLSAVLILTHKEDGIRRIQDLYGHKKESSSKTEPKLYPAKLELFHQYDFEVNTGRFRHLDILDKVVCFRKEVNFFLTLLGTAIEVWNSSDNSSRRLMYRCLSSEILYLLDYREFLNRSLDEDLQSSLRPSFRSALSTLSNSFTPSLGQIPEYPPLAFYVNIINILNQLPHPDKWEHPSLLSASTMRQI